MLQYISEFRDQGLYRTVVESIGQIASEVRGNLTFMEFCGGHTHAIMRYGLRQSLPEDIRMLSGPGCPVCVTAQEDIDRAIALAEMENVTLATFGDMLRVPGSNGSLQDARSVGADVRVVYSVLDALKLAAESRDRQIVFLAIGFETTAPGVAAGVLRADAESLHNFSVLSLHKLTPPAMRAIIDAGEVRLDGVLGPGHVTTVIGTAAWGFLPREHSIGCAVSGFEPVDMVLAVRELTRMAVSGEPDVINCYRRSVDEKGNRRAQATVQRVFEVTDAMWRGLGAVPDSGLRLRDQFRAFDALARFQVDVPESREPPGCRCGEVLRGVVEPPDCPLFGELCRPESPVGPCMVSSEGACSAYFQYGEACG